MMSHIDRRALIAHLRTNFKINWHGHHGIPHWARVRVYGLMLAKTTGANTHVVELFAFFHDSCRINEYTDDGHGHRGALLASKLQGRFFEATEQEMTLLAHACTTHSDGLSKGDVTVQTCWDADRLDLGRVGITPDPKYLCTLAAKDRSNLHAAHRRALSWTMRE